MTEWGRAPCSSNRDTARPEATSMTTKCSWPATSIEPSGLSSRGGPPSRPNSSGPISSIRRPVASSMTTILGPPSSTAKVARRPASSSFGAASRISGSIRVTSPSTRSTSSSELSGSTSAPSHVHEPSTGGHTCTIAVVDVTSLTVAPHRPSPCVASISPDRAPYTRTPRGTSSSVQVLRPVTSFVESGENQMPSTPYDRVSIDQSTDQVATSRTSSRSISGSRTSGPA